MSNAIRYDSLLLRALALELDARLRGVRVRRAAFERATRTLVLALGPRHALQSLCWRLQPTSGLLLLTAGEAPGAGATLQLPPGAAVARVVSLPDERIVRIELASGEAAPGLVRALVVELVGTRWNGLALGADDVIVDVLVARDAGPRELRAGATWVAPAARARLGLAAPPTAVQWRSIMQSPPAGERVPALLSNFAYTSALNAAWILGSAAAPDVDARLLDEAYHRYLQLVSSPPRPCLLNGEQPYPQPLHQSDVPAPTLLAAFALAARAAGTPPPTGDAALREQALAHLHELEQRLRVRLSKLQQEAAGGEADAARLRADADLLLANLHQVARGCAELELVDFAGQPRRLQLDPAHSAQHNARHWYEQARRREHAARRVPALVERAQRELLRLGEVRARVQAGDMDTIELQGLVQRSTSGAGTAALPYRVYRSRSGLEVRVGRNARANDVLIREHAGPEDIWLHARGAGGAHVILRWGRREQLPPRADLLEAAALAACHSRARTSAVVPVDWTRRKYVRKPRKAPPGLVVPERASTLFVAPDAAIERRLRVPEGGE